MNPSFLPVVLLLESAVPGTLVPEVRHAIAAPTSSNRRRRRSVPLNPSTAPRRRCSKRSPWLGRGALAAHRFDLALKSAARTEELAEKVLPSHKLESEPRLATALGAAIEVHGQVRGLQGDRSGALEYLHERLERYQSTPIRARIQKNINLLGLEGKPAPALNAREHLGAALPSLASLRGKPVLLFFWAHWCPDCKAQVPVLAALLEQFHGEGLTLIAPTQRYGYVARGAAASPAEELPYIDQVRHKHYQPLLAASVPVSEELFKVYGASTVPLFVLIDRAGIVRMYHPGQMSLDELAARVKALPRH